MAAWSAMIDAGSASNCSVFAPSTGLLAVMHFRQRCRSVRLFGFGPSERRGHYWQPDMNLRKEVNLSIERSLFRQWRSSDVRSFSIAGEDEEIKRGTMG